MANQQVILVVDEAGNFKGNYVPKEAGHIGEGKKHLAISVLLYNKKGQVLLQKRKHKIFGGLWDVTGATHPLHKKNGKDETLEEATLRCLKKEYCIKEKVMLQNLGFFNYFAEYGKYCENEHCAILVGNYNGSVNLNSEVGYEYKWMDKTEFLQDLECNPQNYTPWAIKALEFLKKKFTVG